MTTKTYLEQAIEDGHAKITGDGKTQRIHYAAASHSERWSDPEEKVRAEFWAELIYKYQYRPERMRFEVKVPRRTPNDLADIVIYGDKDDELKSPWFVFECKRYLARWEWQEPFEESLWDCAARKAVEDAIERADWDEATRQITLFDRDDDRIRETVSTREELDKYLSQVAASAFYANAPRVDGDYLDECDEYGILERVLMDYEERLEDFFRQDVPADDLA